MQKMVKLLEQSQPSAQMQEILAVSSDPDPRNFDINDMDDFQKMSKEEFLMAQIDLDPIESQYSLEQKMKSTSIYNNPNQAMNKTKMGRSSDPYQMQQSGRKHDNTMNNQSFNSISQGKSIQNESIGNSGVFNSPGKPPRNLAKSAQGFFKSAT